MTSGRWLRIAPDDSSIPLQTMSYWNALMSSGSMPLSASISPCGMLNGLWLKSMRPVSSFSSYIGKSVIQQNRNSPSAISPRSAPRRVRTWPANFARRRVARAGGEEHGVAGSQAASRADRLGTRRFEVARDRAFGAAFVEYDVAEPAGALLARPLIQLVEEAARMSGRAGGRDGAHHAARCGDFREQPEA